MKSQIKTGYAPNVPGGLAATFWLLVTVVPIYYIVVTSLKPRQEYFGSNPLAWPQNLTFEAYGRVLENDFALYFFNSALVTVVSVGVVLIISLLASYVIVRNRGAFAKFSHRLFLLGIAIPIQATIIPVYYMIVKMGLYDSLLALILPSIAFAIPISVLILTNFLRDVPSSLYEAMTLDGASHWQMFRLLVLPLSKPAIMAVGIYNALQVWNGFLFPLVLTQSSEVRVLPLSLWTYQGEFAVDIPAVLAAVVLSCVPLLAAYIVGRRQLVAGLTAGFSK
ncbi:ABC transporter permease [Arthrobacter sp. MYb211]|uniref:carbohydrate ABC transporter permease n=1 Tax=unclassified Arthrobacter TaxID=235627 RepID=UPI000CFD6A59|nr:MULTISPECIES: carbohydrate ABC transporter permease [unclassified Arthrobacter]PRA04447.1 ABC transporter permease [Arthrobacter sp. MYb229]PRA12184.1 ABC transporter permease [Arthrobacter sp. MYb221]PRB51640.1 ABC transporter permease [Arthrobacter sp. MYb216]PRC08647.1 ABC transporter permease [Arthrobacter sp. MYb211]